MGRSPSDLVFANEFDTWAASPKTRLELTVDAKDDKWTGRVALIPRWSKSCSSRRPTPSPSSAVRPSYQVHPDRAKEAGAFRRRAIVTTLEGKMKCGLASAPLQRGRQVRLQGRPVFTFKQISAFWNSSNSAARVPCLLSKRSKGDRLVAFFVCQRAVTCFPMHMANMADRPPTCCLIQRQCFD